MALYDDEHEKTYEGDETAKDRKSRLRRYRSQIETAQKWRKDNYDEDWRDFIMLYANNHFNENEYEDLEDMEHKISVPVSFATINIIYPSVSVARPKITVTATKPEDMERAETIEAVVNYWWRHFEYQDEFRQAVKDYLILGHGWLKTTYLFDEEEVDRAAPEVMAELQAQLLQKYTALEQRPEDEALFPTDQEIADLIPTVKKVVLEDHPQVERVSPFDMLVDPDATRLFDARWITQRIAVPIAEAKERKDWNAKVRKDMIGSKTTMKETDGFFDDQVDKETSYVMVYEHYDLVSGTLCTFGENGDDFLVEPKEIPYNFGHPFIMLRNYEVPERLYPLGELECLEDLQLELDFTRSAQLRDLLGHVRKYASRKGMLDQENMERLASRADGELVQVEESAPDNVKEAIVLLDTMDIPQQTYQMSSVIQDDMTRGSGVSDYQMGAMPEIRRTATEAGIIQDSANARAADKLAQIEIALARVARRVIQLGQQFLTVEQVARVAGDDGTVEWVDFDKTSIQGEYDFEIEAGSTQPQNETFRRQSALQLMDAVSSPLFAPQPDPMTGIPVPILDSRKLAEHVLRYGFGIKNAQEFLVPEPPPPPMDPMTGMPMDPAMMGGMGGPPMEGEGETGAPPPMPPPQMNA